MYRCSAIMTVYRAPDGSAASGRSVPVALQVAVCPAGTTRIPRHRLGTSPATVLGASHDWRPDRLQEHLGDGGEECPRLNRGGYLRPEAGLAAVVRARRSEWHRPEGLSTFLSSARLGTRTSRPWRSSGVEPIFPGTLSPRNGRRRRSCPAIPSHRQFRVTCRHHAGEVATSSEVNEPGGSPRPTRSREDVAWLTVLASGKRDVAGRSISTVD